MKTIFFGLTTALLLAPSFYFKENDNRVLKNESYAYVGDYYQSITATSGNELLSQIRDLMVSTHKTYTSYDDSGKNMKQTQVDYDPSNPNTRLIDFYTHASMANPWNSGNLYNREHVWCQSLSNGLWGDTLGGADMHHIRPTFKSVNSSRNNRYYSEFDSSISATSKTYTYEGKKYDYGFTYGADYFEPIDKVKGDVARIVLYIFTHYNSPQYLKINNLNTSTTNIGNVVSNDKGSGNLPITNLIQFVNKTNNKENAFDMLVRWNQLDPVDQFEINRNNGVYAIQGNRNPFIDYPEYVDAIWGETSIEEGNLIRLEVNQNYQKEVGFNAKYDLNSIKINAIYDNGTTKDVTSLCAFSTIDTSKLGKQVLTASYQGMSIDINVRVTNTISSPSTGIIKTYIGAPNKNTWSNNNSDGTINNVIWHLSGTIGGDGSIYFGTDSNKGVQIGKAAAPYTSLTIYSNHFKNYEIEEITVETSGASNINANLVVKVNNNTYQPGSTKISSANDAYTFTGASKGNVELIYSQTSSKAIYLKSITIKYKEASGPAYTPKQQASAYADYFINQTSKYCLGNNANHDAFIKIVDDGVWQDLKIEYEAMSNEAKQEFLNHEESNVAMAYERYSLIVNKYFDVEDFASLRTNTKLNINNMIMSNETMIFTIMLLAIAVFTLCIALFIYDKRIRIR